MMTATMLDAALDYARRGWPVFPLHSIINGRCTCEEGAGCHSPGKHPRIVDWPNQATTDPATIRQWWTRWPGANIGIPTGKASRFFVLDGDPRNGGDDTLRELEAKYGALPSTVESQTGGGGFHKLFKYPGPIKSGAGVLGHGLDIRGDGGYIVAPQSLHASGRRYEWEVSSHPDDVAIAEAPTWLLPMLTAKANGNGHEQRTDWLTLLQGVPKGGRYDVATRIAGHFLGIGRPVEEVETLILGYLSQCIPPGDAEEREKARRMVRDFAAKDAATGGAEQEGHTEGGQPGKGRKSLSDALVDFRDLLAIQLPERQRYLPWLAAASSVMVFGPRGVGKTNFGLGLATALTTATPFLRSQVTDPVGVLYVDGEMQLDELRSRTCSLLASPYKAPLLFLTSELVYHRTQRDLVLSSEPARAEITAILDSHTEVKIVILDNVSTLFSGIDEDSKHHWEPIAAWLIKLRHRGLATVLVHHTGNSGRQRGTSGREDSLDTVISLTLPAGYDAREGCHFELRFTKSRSVKGDDVAPLDVKLTEQEGRLTWVYSLLEESKLDQVKALLANGVTGVSDIAEELGISKGYASKLVGKARGKP